MDALIKQVRAKLPNVGQDNTSSSNPRMPLQKIQSFRGEKKKAQNWFQRQLSRQISRDYDPNIQIEHAAAVAATAYAIKSMKKTPSPDQKNNEGLFPFLTRLRSKKEDTSVPVQDITSESPQRQLSFTRLRSKKDDAAETSANSDRFLTRLKSKKEDTPGNGSKRFSGGPVDETPEIAAVEEKAPEKPVEPPKKKTSSFADNVSNSSGTTQFKRSSPSKDTDPPWSTKRTPTFDNGEARQIPIKPDAPPSFKPLIASEKTKRQNSVKPGIHGEEVDAWEKSELDKIKERHEKLENTIQSWEVEKKKKARNKLDRTEGHLAERRLKALKKFRNEMETVEQVAKGATEKAWERRRHEEKKAKEKANTIRTTGKTTATCFCFRTHQ